MAADLRSIALKVAANALKQYRPQPQPPPEPTKPHLSTGSAMLLGAGLATAGRALASARGREMVGSLRDRIDEHAGHGDGEESDEPEAEDDEDFEDEEESDEPEAEDDEDFDDEEESDEPEAEDDEDFDDEEESAEPEAEEGDEEDEEDEDDERPGRRRRTRAAGRR